MLMHYSIPLVGMHFRPPAKEVLSVLAIGTPLILRPEPENQYDRNAVVVEVDMGDFPPNRVPLLNNILAEPWSASEICAKGLFMLGYLAATGAKTAKGGPGNAQALLMISTYGLVNIKVTLGSAPEGYPVVNLEGPDYPVVDLPEDDE